MRLRLALEIIDYYLKPSGSVDRVFLVQPNLSKFESN